MRFWDSSAIVPLLVREEHTHRRLSQWKSDPRMTVWWAARLECASALTRLRREGVLEEEALGAALGDLDRLAESWYEVLPGSEIRARALRLVRVHPLRAADALQLAAALIATSENPPAMQLLTSDDRLREAAQKEGFSVD